MFPGRRVRGWRPAAGGGVARRLAAMPIDGEYEPSAWDWVSDQVDLYESVRRRRGIDAPGRPVRRHHDAGPAHRQGPQGAGDAHRA